MKRCTKCGIEKPDEVFEMQPSKGRRRSECRECRTIAQREWREKRKQHPPQRKPETKKCAHCQQIKPISEFSPADPGYYQPRCKHCINSIRREKRIEQYRNDPTGLFYRTFTNEEGITVKRCVRCHVEKPTSEFYKNSPKRLHSRCKDCDKEVKKADYDADPEKHREFVRRSMRKYPERHQARFKRWASVNRQRLLQRYREYNETHRAERRAYDRLRHSKETPEFRRMWYEKRREKILAYAKAYRENNRDKINAWRKANLHKLADREQRRNARKRNAPRIEKIDRQAIIERDKWTCYLCMQICTPKNVTLDHVVPLFRGGSHVADNLRVACRSCNCRKGTRLLHDFLK